MIERLFILELHSSRRKVSDVFINQGNVDSTTFRYKIFDKGNEVDYGKFSEARAVFAPRNGRAAAAVTCEVQSGGISCVVPSEALARGGVVNGQLDLYTGDSKLTTNYFSFIVVPSLAKLSEGDRRFFMDEIDKMLHAANELAKFRDCLEEFLDRVQTKAITEVGNVNVTTLAPDSQASVSVGQNGNSLDLSFGIPRGIPGIDGIDGRDGIDGKDGKDGESNHPLLDNLDYENSGHTGFASQKALESTDSDVDNLREALDCTDDEVAELRERVSVLENEKIRAELDGGTLRLWW